MKRLRITVAYALAGLTDFLDQTWKRILPPENRL